MKVTLIDRHLMRLTEISANAPTHYFCKDGEITFIVVLERMTRLQSEDKLNAYEIAYKLNTSIVGRDVVYFDSLDSTNNYARKLAMEGCSEGTTVVAAQQTAGKGRLGRSWESPLDKGIYMSVVIRPSLSPAETQIFTLAAAVAVSNAMSKKTGLETGIKWPNDLIVDSRKVCGILLEMSAEEDSVNYLIIGIGINYSQNECDFGEELRDKAVSLKKASEILRAASSKGSAAGSRLSIVRSVLQELDVMTQLILTNNNARILELWRNKSITLGRSVRFKLKDKEYTGTAVDITEDGRLMVECSDGVIRELLSGEVSVRGIYGYI